MSLRLANLLEAVKTGFWAIPLFAMLIAGMLAAAAYALDNLWVARLFTDGALPDVLRAADPDTVRTLLTSIGAGTLGVLGIAFSVTVTTLVLASQQFGPHVLRNYMGKRFVQVVLGAFVGTTLYAFLVLFLAAPLAAGPDSAGPVCSVLLALSLLTADLILLVLFIHHTASPLRVDSIIADIHDDLLARLDCICPQRPRLRYEGDEFDCVSTASLSPDILTTMVMTTSGYIQAIDRDGMMASSRKAGLVVQLLYSPGDYVIAGETLANVHDDDRHNSANRDHDVHLVSAALFRRHLTIGAAPTPQQDPDFSIRQLVQIALRALSPALNDPFTAISCVDRLASMVRALLERDPRGGWYHDVEHDLRYHEPMGSHASSVALAFDQIIDAADDHPTVSISLRRKLTTLVELDADRACASPLRARLQRLERQIYDAVAGPV